MKKIISLGAVLIVSLFAFQSCRQGPPIRMAERVDLDLYMGNWYVIANIPTFIEKSAYNAVETYVRKPDNVIDTTFTFNKDSLDGQKKEYKPTGFVQDNPSNAEWKMQFLWPFKSEFIIVYVDSGYTYTIVGRTKRDYLWIMAREPKVSDADLERLIQIAVDEGYDRDQIRMVPHDNP